MSHPYEYHNFVLREIPKSVGLSLIFDAGCGLGIWGYLLRATRLDNVGLVGSDIAKPYLSFTKNRMVYDALIRADLSQLPFRDRIFDYILAAEVIEHVPKHKARRVLAEFSRCCKGKTIVTTPNGFKAQHGKQIPSEEHLSGWTVKELRSYGFKVRGIGNRFYPLERASMTLWAFFHYVTTPFAQLAPSLGEYLVAVRIADASYRLLAVPKTQYS
jgi:ubiquinone/menaquinone biosynthesis C-methylase UbiE